jgi:hypothetical protein
MKITKNCAKDVRWSKAFSGIDKVNKDFLNTVPLIQVHYTLSYTALIHSSHSYTVLIHSSHTLYSYTLPIATLYSYTVLTHSTHTLYS